MKHFSRSPVPSNHRQQLAAAALLTLAGCTTPKPHISPAGNGPYTAARQVSALPTQFEELKEIALSEANIYCLNHSKTLHVVSIKEIPTRVPGRRSEAEVMFTCN